MVFERPPFLFDPQALRRELARHYIPATEADLAAMAAAVGISDLSDLYSHIDQDMLFAEGESGLPEELEYEAVAERMAEIAGRNEEAVSFIGDALPDWAQPSVVGRVAGLRSLATSYTPYQPERSQGTLISQWIYQSLLSRLTGFEAVNASLYDRSTAMVEAALCSVRLSRKASTVFVAESCFPQDREVLATLLGDTDVRLEVFGESGVSGSINPEELRERLAASGDAVAGVIFPQVNQFGILEPVDAITDVIHAAGCLAIAVVDPFLLGPGGLKPPSAFGKKGADMLVGEAQHLALGPNFGGPGLGLFAVRHNSEVKNVVRATPGRYVGEAVDGTGRNCRVMVLSTREQHIRKDKATSNICSNQAFVATLAGAALLSRGDAGLERALSGARRQMEETFGRLTAIPEVRAAFPEGVVFNEVVLELPEPVANFLDAAAAEGVHAGVDVSARVGGRRSLLKISFSDRQDGDGIEKLVAVFERRYGAGGACGATALPLPDWAVRRDPAGIRGLGDEETGRYFERLAGLNIAPEETCYPLGSCTMKYNPYLNEWAAGLRGFTDTHPQAPESAVQGCLEVLYEIQEWFKGITGLPGVTTQPVAGAQGELVGLKLFQAYHRSRNEGHRNLMLIPHSAHGTNFATATMAGYTEARGGGIVLLEADATGRIDRRDFEAKLARYGDRIAGIMITNPNTGGVFEDEFAHLAERVHEVGGLVYMDGANMNAIAGWTHLGRLGVDAVHNNLHKTWTIPHGGGGPGDAIVAVSGKLVEFLPGYQIVEEGGNYRAVRPPHSIGSFHRHWGNFAHKVRAYSYLLRLGQEGVRRMSAVAVLAARYLHERLRPHFKTLPVGADAVPRMHEFIISLHDEDFQHLEAAGIPKAQVIPSIGKLFLDFGYHAPTVAFPEVFGLMIEPTESYRKDELDRFADAVIAIGDLVRESPDVLKGAPYFTPVGRIDEVAANRNPVLAESLDSLPEIHEARVPAAELLHMPVDVVVRRIQEAASGRLATAG